MKKNSISEEFIEIESKPIRATGILELDAMLKGGLPAQAVVLLAGVSGTGKTILATQWLFAGYQKFQEPGIYISMTEPVAKAVKNASKLSFFKRENLGPLQVYFTDLRGILKGLGLEEKTFTRKEIRTVIESLENMVKQSGAKRVVIDSITAMAYRLKDKDLIRDFIFQLGTLLAQLNVNVILTGELVGAGYSVFGVEEFISDGIIKLSYRRNREELIRIFELVKMRGADYDSHPAMFKISKEGIRLFPHLSRQLIYKVSNRRLSSGLAGLDQMTGGGFFEGSSMLVTGSSGTGKTVTALQFTVSGLKSGQKSVFVSFEESRDQLVNNAKDFGWNLEEYEKSGLLKIITSYPEHFYLEEHIDRIRTAVESFEPKLLVVDSLSSLGNVFSADVLRDFLSRLNAYLKDKLVTALYTNATATMIGGTQISEAHLSTIIDNIILLRFVEIGSELKHALLILKMRGSKHDKKLREFVFTDKGLEILSDFSGFEGLILGSTRKISASVQDQLHALFIQTLGPMGEKIFEEEKAKGLKQENITKMINQLGGQGIVSSRRKEEFIRQAEVILK